MRTTSLGRFRSFVRTPKGLTLLPMVLLISLAGYAEGPALVAPCLGGAIAAAMLVDLPVLRLRKRRWVFPDGALLTGLFVAMILSPMEPWWVAAATAAIAVASKYVFRSGSANVFNPAALALVVTFHLLDTAQSWWGALPEMAPAFLLVLLASGAFVAVQINKVPVVLSFLGTYYLAATMSAFLGDPALVAELYRAPDLHAALFFAFFMMTDPPTSPPRHRDQLLYGGIAALTAYGAFELLGAADFLLIGVLSANLWEAWHRVRSRRKRAASSPPSGAIPPP